MWPCELAPLPSLLSTPQLGSLAGVGSHAALETVAQAGEGNSDPHAHPSTSLSQCLHRPLRVIYLPWSNVEHADH